MEESDWIRAAGAVLALYLIRLGLRSYNGFVQWACRRFPWVERLNGVDAGWIAVMLAVALIIAAVMMPWAAD